MPSQKTASKEVTKEMVECEVLRGIGIDATAETLKEQRDRAKTKGLRFVEEGLTTMIFPNKDVLENGKVVKEADPVFIMLEKEVARKLQKAGAVRVNI